MAVVVGNVRSGLCEGGHIHWEKGVLGGSNYLLLLVRVCAHDFLKSGCVAIENGLGEEFEGRGCPVAAVGLHGLNLADNGVSAV